MSNKEEGKKAYKLEDKHKRYIVAALARFEKPKTIIKGLKRIYKITVVASTICYYNPDYLGKIGEKLCDELQEYFIQQREEYRNSINRIPIANQVNRFELYQKMIDKFVRAGNFVEVRNTCQQVAKELGGMYIAKNFQSQINTINTTPHEDAAFTDEQLLTAINSAIASTDAGAEKTGTETTTSTEIIP